MRKLLLIISSFLLLASCTTKEPVVSKGSFTIDGTSYSFSALRVDHVGYENGDSSRFILRLTAYPGTFKCDTAKYTGYGTILRLFIIADVCDIYPGTSYSVISTDSVSEAITISESKDTTSRATISAASVSCSTADNDFQKYVFSLTTSSGTTSGEYTGTHIVNRTVDQPSCGLIEFDTISTNLASAMLYKWGSLFGAGTNYYEFIIYSTNSRFNDNGTLRFGTQFSLGIMSASDSIPSAGDYTVAIDYTKGSVLYGHKVGDASWGTYWTTYYSSSAVGKANILDGTLTDFKIDGNSASFSFNFTDQLANEVVGNYDGTFVTR